jgi:hypothetical protein
MDVFPELPRERHTTWTFRARRQKAEAPPLPEEPTAPGRELDRGGRIRLPSVQEMLGEQAWLPPLQCLASEDLEKSDPRW